MRMRSFLKRATSCHPWVVVCESVAFQGRRGPSTPSLERVSLGVCCGSQSTPPREWSRSTKSRFRLEAEEERAATESSERGLDAMNGLARRPYAAGRSVRSCPCSIPGGL